MKDVKMFATNTKTGERMEIRDLYWFEEHGVHDFDGEGHYENYSFEIIIRGVMIYSSAKDDRGKHRNG